MWEWLRIGANAFTLVALIYIIRQQRTIRRNMDTIRRLQRERDAS